MAAMGKRKTDVSMWSALLLGCVVSTAWTAPTSKGPGMDMDMDMGVATMMPGHEAGHEVTHDPGNVTHDPAHMGGPPGMTHDPGDHDPCGEGHDPSGGGHDPSGSGGHSGFFFFGVDSLILFKDWVTDDWQTMLGSCVGLGVLAALYEGLKVFRENMLRRHIACYCNETKTNWSLMCSRGHFSQSILHIVQVTISYALMLAVMTFNVWICIAVVLGAGIGYLVFGWNRATATDSTEHCN